MKNRDAVFSTDNHYNILVAHGLQLVDQEKSFKLTPLRIVFHCGMENRASDTYASDP